MSEDNEQQPNEYDQDQEQSPASPDAEDIRAPKKQKTTSDTPSPQSNILQQINDNINNIRNRLPGQGKEKSVQRAKKLQKSYTDPYRHHHLNEDKIKDAADTKEFVAKPNALKLKARKAVFDKVAQGTQAVLDPSPVSGPNAKEPVAHGALKIADKLDNILSRQASKMKQERRIIKQQEAIAKAGPYGRIVALVWGCKNWCLGHAVIICTLTGGLAGVVLKLTGAI